MKEDMNVSNENASVQQVASATDGQGCISCSSTGSKTAADVRQIVLDIVAEIAPDASLDALKDNSKNAASGLPAEETRLRDLLGLDSMDFLDIVMELRKKHHLDVPEADYPKLETLKSCVEYLLPKFNTRRDGQTDNR